MVLVSWCLYYTDTWKLLCPYNSEAIENIEKVITILWTSIRKKYLLLKSTEYAFMSILKCALNAVHLWHSAFLDPWSISLRY